MLIELTSGRTEIMETLLDAGMDPNRMDAETGEMNALGSRPSMSVLIMSLLFLFNLGRK